MEKIFIEGPWVVWDRDDGVVWYKWRAKSMIIIKKDGNIIGYIKV